MKKSREKILIVDDERFIRMTLAEAVRSWNYEPLEAGSIDEAKKVFALNEPSVILLDIDLPDGSGLDVLNEIKSLNPEVIAIMVTGNVDVTNTVAALRGGAYDFISKPVSLEDLRITLRNALETRVLRREVRRIRNEQSQTFSFGQIIGESRIMKRTVELAERIAVSDVSAILLQGESGTGKDLFARAIHYASERSESSYVAINCAALPANLVESELFGYEKGAFTDARQKKEGLFEQAQGGTIFLDEIGEMELPLQAKLLRVLEEGAFRRVGGLRDIQLDARIITASNRDLKAESEKGTFRLDLYYRLSIIQIDIPPLRDRDEDCLLLAQHYLSKANQKRRGAILRGFSPEVIQTFKNHNWAGNVRELRNVIERASILEDGELITTTFLPADLKNHLPVHKTVEILALPTEGIALEEVELNLINQALIRSGGNLTRASKLLHISRDQLRYRLKKAGIYENKQQK